MGFINWITGFASSVGDDIRKAVDFVVNGLKTLWHLFTGIATNVIREWGVLRHELTVAAFYLYHLARNTYLQIRRLLVVTLPALVKNTLTAAAKYAAQLTLWVKRGADAALHTLTRWVTTVVADVRAFAVGAYRKLSAVLSKALGTLDHVARLVAARLTHPEALVTWILGPLVKALLRLALTWAEPLARLLLRSGARLALQAVTVIEKVIADVL